MSAQWPLVKARAVALLPTLPGWAAVSVFNGAAFDVKTTMFATDGHATDGTNTHAGNYTKQLAPDGYRYVEQGSVACQLASGADGDIAVIESQVFALFDELEAAIRADHTLGVTSPDGYVSLTVDVGSAQQLTGVAYDVAFSLDYFTVT